MYLLFILPAKVSREVFLFLTLWSWYLAIVHFGQHPPMLQNSIHSVEKKFFYLPFLGSSVNEISWQVYTRSSGMPGFTWHEKSKQMIELLIRIFFVFYKVKKCTPQHLGINRWWVPYYICTWMVVVFFFSWVYGRISHEKRFLRLMHAALSWLLHLHADSTTS